MSVKRLHHIGIAVKNLETSMQWVTDVLGLKLEKVETVESEQVRVAFFQVGETKLELLEPLTEDGTIAHFLHKRGEGIHHLAFEVDGLGELLTTLAAKDVSLIHNQPKAGADEMEIAFVHPKSTGGVLIECCESTRK